MNLPRLAVAAAVVALTAACGGGSSGSPAAAPATSAPAATPANSACTAGLKLGQPGVVTIACDGTAVMKVSGSANGQISGGTCTTAAGLFVVNAGVVVDHTFTGPKPNFLSVNTPPQGGGGPDTAATVVMDGKLYGGSGRFGGTTTFSADLKSLEFKGTADTGGDQVTIDVTC
jgi:hypothetical protein